MLGQEEAGAEPGATYRRLYGVLRSQPNALSVQNIRNTAAAAGFDLTRVPATSERRSGLGSRAEVMPALDRLFGEMSHESQRIALTVLAGQIARQQEADDVDAFSSLLASHGFEFVDGEFRSISAMEPREKAFLPTQTLASLARAMDRLADGDYSGAITSACGAVDAVTQDLYGKLGLGDPGKASFQAKVNTSASRLRSYEKLKNDLIGHGMSNEDADALVKHTRLVIANAAESLQILRRSMGDAHGVKDAPRYLAYDAVKWASAICAFLAPNEG